MLVRVKVGCALVTRRDSPDQQRASFRESVTFWTVAPKAGAKSYACTAAVIRTVYAPSCLGQPGLTQPPLCSTLGNQ